mgnify:CR=1 FL=1
MKRIFVAVDISEEARRQAAAHIENLKKQFPRLRVGWERPEKLHLTLKFLGDTDDWRLANLTEAVESAAARQISNFKLQVSSTGVFPNQRRARVLWLGVIDGSGNLRKLNETLENECAARGLAREQRDFKAHLTIARLREPEKSGSLIEAHLRQNFEAVDFEISEIVIYESELLPQGSRYKIVSKHAFDSISEN